MARDGMPAPHQSLTDLLFSFSASTAADCYPDLGSSEDEQDIDPGLPEDEQDLDPGLPEVEQDLELESEFCGPTLYPPMEDGIHSVSSDSEEEEGYSNQDFFAPEMQFQESHKPPLVRGDWKSRTRTYRNIHTVMLDASPENPHPEKEAAVNIGLAAFDLLEEIKAAIEKRCPGVVSCSDILIYAARDAASALSNGNIHFEVPARRLDGVVSSAAEAQAELPDSTFTAQQLIDNFARKDFDVEEMVILSGAHSIGVGHCSSFTGRLTAPKEQIDPAYRNLLNYKCHAGGAGANPAVVNNVRDEDYGTVAKFMPGFTSRVRKISDFLDNSYYHNNLARIVSFNSDRQLLTHEEARGHVHEYADNATLWDGDFADSMLKLSKLSMPDGSKGGIRKKCSIATHPLY